MLAFAFSLCHAEFVRDFPFSSFEECLEKLESMEQYIQTEGQQIAHDTLVESTYSFYEGIGEDYGFEIVL